MTKVKFAWHVHHNQLAEVLIRPMTKRRAYIKSEKRAGEVATRLRLFHSVKGQLPTPLVGAAEAYIAENQIVIKKGWSPRLLETRREYKQQLLRYGKALEKLHAEECPNCPWDGRTIFPYRGIKP